MYTQKEILSNQELYNAKMESLFEKLEDKVVAVGECGLDYDRLEYSNIETQLRFDE
jgi:TatD DNase family protein